MGKGLLVKASDGNDFAGRVKRRLSADERFHGKIGTGVPAKMNFEGSNPKLGTRLCSLADLAELASGPHCAQPSQPQHAESPTPGGE